MSAYRGLKDRELARDGGRFIAEGEAVVRRLLASDFPVESVFVAQKRAEAMWPLVRGRATMYVASAAVVSGVMGFKFHSGVIACGRRKPPARLEEIVGDSAKALALVACPDLSNTENLGSLVRIAAGLGADAVLLGENCCDAFFRQSIRVSMGAVFAIPIVRSRRFLDDLGWLKRRGVAVVATTPATSATPLDEVSPPQRAAVLFGNEAQGLGAEVMAAADLRVQVPMHHGTDSLNVSVSAGIILYHLLRGRRR